MRLLKIALMASFAFSLFCAKSPSTRPKILVSPKGLVHSFWTTVKAGAEQAGKDYGVDVIWKGPAVETDIAGQVALVEDNINKRVNAIVLAACDATALVPIIQKAVDADIPVITIDSGVDSDLPLSFIATDNIAGARLAADVLAKLLDGKGKVACIPFVPGAATSIMREQGFKEGLKDHPGLDLVAVQYSQSEVATAMAVTENILTAHPDLGGIFAGNEAGSIGCSQALISRGLAGKVKMVAFDASPDQIKELQSGVIQALVVQNPFKMGYEGVKAAVMAINGETIEKRIDTGVTVVTQENFADSEIQKLLNPPIAP